MLSRRNLLATGAAAGIASLVPSEGLHAAIGAESPTSRSVSDFVAVLSASDPRFSTMLDNHFPRLGLDSTFRQIQSGAALVTNVSKQPISALSTHWTISSSSGGYETRLLHYFHPSISKPKLIHFGLKGNKTRFTGNVPVLRPGATRLVTPFFSWGPSYLRTRSKVRWKRFFNASASRRFWGSELPAAGEIGVTIDSLIVDQKVLVGEDRSKLSMVFRITRNAEHDEAASIMRSIEKGADQQDVVNTLLQHSNGTQLIRAVNPNKYLYQSVRARQAEVLLRRLNYGGWEKFLRTVKYLRQMPKTTTGLTAASKPKAS